MPIKISLAMQLPLNFPKTGSDWINLPYYLKNPVAANLVPVKSQSADSASSWAWPAPPWYVSKFLRRWPPRPSHPSALSSLPVTLETLRPTPDWPLNQISCKGRIYYTIIYLNIFLKNLLNLKFSNSEPLEISFYW